MNLFSSSTPLDPQVEAATAETLKLPDIGINMEICDNINRDRAGGANILKSIKRRLQSKSTRTVMLTLDLLEMCVKNCHRGFHAELAKKDNLDAVVEVATKKNQQLDIRDKSLLLIMSWAEAFHKQQEFPTYWETYQKLLQKGVIFPARDLSTLAPVFTPPAHTQPKPATPSNTINIPSSSQSRPVNGKHPFSWLSPEFVVKTKTELQVVVNYVRVFRDLLTASPHSGPQLSTDEALLSLSRTLSEIRTRLANLIVGVMEHEELLDLSIQMNEQVRICLEWYQARVTNAHYNPAPLMIPPALAALDPSNQRSNEQKGERDEKDDFASLAEREQKSDDTFAALARSRMETPKHQHPQGERSPAVVSSSSAAATQDLLPSLDAITLQFDPVITKQTSSQQQQISFDPFAPVSQQQPMSAPVPAPVPVPAAAAAAPAAPTDSSFFDFINATSSPNSNPNPNPNLTSPLSSPDSLNDFIEISDQMNKTTISNNNNGSSGSGGPSLI